MGVKRAQIKSSSFLQLHLARSLRQSEFRSWLASRDPGSRNSLDMFFRFVSLSFSAHNQILMFSPQPTILSRTNRLTHPPPLSRNNKTLTYGVGIPAPWNANNVLSTADGAPNPTNNVVKESSSQLNGKAVPSPVLPDARLFATWDHDHKDFRAPLVPAKQQRTRMGSIQVGAASGSTIGGNDLERKPSAGTISLGARGRASSRVG